MPGAGWLERGEECMAIDGANIYVHVYKYQFNTTEAVVPVTSGVTVFRLCKDVRHACEANNTERN
jgi:hypothetical protein